MVDVTGTGGLPEDRARALYVGSARPPWQSAVAWGSIFAGFIVAIALYAVLTVLGLGIGLNVLPGTSIHTTGIAAGIWSIVMAIISLFVGGLVTGLEIAPTDSGKGALHGLIVWGLATLLMLWVVGAGMATVTGGAFRVASTVAGGAVSGVTSAAGEVANGAAQNPTAARAAAHRADSADEALRSQAGNAAQTFSTEAGEVAQGTTGIASGAAWGVFVALVLTAIAAALGASLTARRHDRLDRDAGLR